MPAFFFISGFLFVNKKRNYIEKKKEIIKKADIMGIKYLTVYAFSTENWKRPQEEVDAIMQLFREYLNEAEERKEENREKGISLRFIGDRKGIPEDIQALMEHIENESQYNWLIIGLTAENRDVLYDRINRRVDIMMSDGLIEEAEKFFASEKSSTAKQAIGYKELKGFFDGLISLEESIENLKRETRRYAKRQLTWFNRNKDVKWIVADGLDSEKIFEKAKEFCEEYLF